MLTRRHFLTASGATVLGMWGFDFAEAQQTPAPAENPMERIRIGCIGMGGQGNGIMRSHLRNVVAVCDVDSERRERARMAVAAANGGRCEAHGDYRRLLENRDIDAVLIATPDHWHALPAIHAVEAGKHVYCEKPLTLTVQEGRIMTRAARRHNKVVQTGSQQRSDERFRKACELVRNGKLGRLREIRVGIPGVNFRGPAVPDSDPPMALDYDFWIGPAPQRPYNVKRVHYNFRFFWDYSGGQITNWGAHHLDIVQWALGMDESGPTAIEGTARFHAQNWFEVPENFRVTYTYRFRDQDVPVICGQGIRGGVTFVGSEGTLFVTRGRIEADPADILRSTFTAEDVRLPVSANHHRNWLESIRAGRRPICDVEIGHRSATVCHLGNIAIRSGRRLRWDPTREQVIDDREQQEMTTKAYRRPWRLPEYAG